MKIYKVFNRVVNFSILIFLFSFTIRVFFALTRTLPPAGDEAFYESIGNSLWLGKGYILNGYPTAVKCPGYPLFIAGIYSLFGHSFVAVRLVQALIDALMCVVVYFIAKRLFNKKIGCVAGILCCVHYFFLKSVPLLRPDTLQMFFIVLSVLYWIKWRESYSKRDIALLGVFSSASIMLKANVLFFPFLIILIESVNFFKNRRLKVNVFMLNMLVFILAISLPIVPWVVRNQKVFGSQVFLSTEMGAALFSSYNPPEGKRFGLFPKDPAFVEALKITSEVEQNKFLTLKAKEYIFTHKKEVIKLLPLKVLFFWSLFDWETLSDNGEAVYNFATAFIIPFALLGLIVLRREFWRLITIILPVLYFSIFIALAFQGLPRFRLPIEPFLIVFAAFGLTYLYEKFSKAKIILCTVAWFLLNFSMFIYSADAKVFVRFIFERIGLW